MTLDQLLQSPPLLDELRESWLVFDSTLKDRLEQVQPHYQHQVSPIALTDGSFALCADLLSEINGIYAQTFAALDQSTFPSVEVLSTYEILPLLPQATEE